MRTALQQQSGFRVIGEAASGRDGLTLLQATKPDVAIVDIGLPDMDGVELTRQFKQLMADTGEEDTKVLILTLHDNQEVVLAAFAAGADSYCMKEASLNTLVDSIRITYEGNSWIDPAIARIVLEQACKQPSTSGEFNLPKSSGEDSVEDADYHQILESSPLTERELEVLKLIVDGCSNADIAERLYITVGTVKTHVRNILNKLCADDRTQAAVRALRSGLVG
jgi:DNA-binding NarL/FixJ family response regulator